MESRAEVIVTEKSALFNVKKVVKTVARTAVGYVHFSPKVTTCIYNHMMSYHNYFHPNYSTTLVIPVCHGSSNFFKFRLFFFFIFFLVFSGVKTVGKGVFGGVKGLGRGIVSVGRGTKNIARGGFNKLGSLFVRSEINDELKVSLANEDNDITVIDEYAERVIDIPIDRQGVEAADTAV